MGSFNETCAISGLPIGCGDLVKLVFLSRNPFCSADEHFYHRGCYHYDHWCMRTPPISGKYDDYGRCKFKENYLTRLIEKMFIDDIVELPFGFNQYHAHSVPKKPTIHQLLDAAWQGRLLVRDTYFSEKDHPDQFPTWQKIAKLLQNRKLKIMKKENDEAYNVQPITEGVVFVHFNSYDNNLKKIKAAEKVVSRSYDCRIVYERDNNEGDCGMIVAPKGSFENHSILCEGSLKIIKNILEHHPKYGSPLKPRKLPVMAVMIRQDVWDVYKNIRWMAPSWHNFDYSFEGFQNSILGLINDKDAAPFMSLSVRFRNVFVSLPFVNTLGAHLSVLLEDDLGQKQKDEAVAIFAEAARVEAIMAQISQAWQVPITSGQETEWRLRKEILAGLHSITERQIYEEEKENED